MFPLGNHFLTCALCDVLAERLDVIVEYIASDTSSALTNSVSSDAIFAPIFLSIFNPTSLHIPYPTFLPYAYLSYVSPFMPFTLTNR